MLSNKSISDFSVEFCFLDLSQRACPDSSPPDDLASNLEEEGVALLGMPQDWILDPSPRQLGLLSTS